MTGPDLRAWRARMQLTQRQAALALGCGDRTYQRAEANGPTETLARLASLLEGERTKAHDVDDENLGYHGPRGRRS